jgi:hypothetical protein
MVAWVRLAVRNDVSSTPSWVTLPIRSGSSTSGVPCSITAFITVHQHTPSSASRDRRHRAGVGTDRAGVGRRMPQRA